MINVKILADSINSRGVRLTTWELEYPRTILAQVNTHRNGFARNTASNRAIPIEKNIEQVKNDMFYPIWTKNKSGMQGEIVEDSNLIDEANNIWLDAFKHVSDAMLRLNRLGIHKQNANRLLEPFQYVKTVLTACNDGLDNFYKLRIHKDAQAEIRDLAIKMKESQDKNDPVFLQFGEWHLPYITEEDRRNLSIDEQKHISVSCCAQVSYRKINTTKEKALAIYEKLINGDIIHGSAFEHVCRPEYVSEKRFGCFNTWHQYRHDVEKEINA